MSFRIQVQGQQLGLQYQGQNRRL